ncbi:sec-independent protein translocase protein TatB [bacterium MnTg02]|nr:sec-independent protein translocase protein TatB [bacterium MnTg02]
MFDIGWSELLIIAAVAIIFVGPKDLPRMLRTVGQTVGKFKRMAGEFRTQFDDALRDSELQELNETIGDIRKSSRMDELGGVLREEVDKINKIASEPLPDVENDGGIASIDSDTMLEADDGTAPVNTEEMSEAAPEEPESQTEAESGAVSEADVSGAALPERTVTSEKSGA